jgi:hypothetical protein
VLDLIEPVPVIERLRLLNQGHGLRNEHETIYRNHRYLKMETLHLVAAYITVRQCCSLI